MDTHDKAINMLVRRGVRFRLPAPRFLRWMLPTHVTIRHLHLGTILLIDQVAKKNDINQLLLSTNAIELAGELSKPLSIALAYAVLNNLLLIRLFAPFLAWLLRWGITPQGMSDLWRAIEQMSDIEAFITSTTSMSKITKLIVMTPMEGHKSEGR